MDKINIKVMSTIDHDKFDALEQRLYGALWVSNGDPVLVESDSLANELAHSIYDSNLVKVTDQEELVDALVRLELSHSTLVFDVFKWFDGSVKNYVVFNYDWSYE